MPMTIVDRLPLPNLKVYTAGSVLVLSVALYHAISATSDPGWRGNATVQLGQEAAADAAGETGKMVPAIAPLDAASGTRAPAEQLADVITYMMQEPLCMWALINISYCGLALAGLAIQRAVFGPLRVSEAQRVRDKLWNYVFYKFIFVFGVLNVHYMEEVLLWCAWFTLLGFLHLLGQLCKDRYEYLSSSPGAGGAHWRLGALVGGVVAGAAALLARAPHWGLPPGRDTLAFMAAECILVIICALHICARYALTARGADAAGPAAYYTHLAFDACSLVVELGHVVHMVVFSNLVVSMPSLVLLMQMRHLLHELQARLRKHRLYTALAHHMSRNYPMASKEEVEKNQDNCAICWEPMKEARKLPCSHLFHNSCLCQWVQQDPSCPTCRRALHAPAPAPGGPAPPTAAPAAAAPARPPTAALPLPLAAVHPNHLFHFDGSRYVSWLPSFSVEVTRVHPPHPAHLARAALAPRIHLMAQQVQQMFPGYPLPLLAADLALTRSPDITVVNILEGRLPPPPPPPPPATETHIAPGSSDSGDERAESSARDAVRRRAAARSAGAGAGASLDATTSTAHQTTLGDLRHDAAHSSSEFSKSASERESLLQRRKEQLIACARQKYLDKRGAAGAAGARS